MPPEPTPTPQKDFEDLQKKIDAQLREFGVSNTPPTAPPTPSQHEIVIPAGFDVEVVDGKMVFKKKEEAPPGSPPAPGAPATPPPATPPPGEPKPPEDDEKKKMLELMTEMKGTMDKMKLDYETKTAELEKKLTEANAADIPIPQTAPTTPAPVVTPPPVSTPPPSTPPVTPPTETPAEIPGQLDVPGTSLTPGEGKFWNQDLGKYEDFSDGYVPYMGAAMLLEFKNKGGSFGGAQPDNIGQ